MRKTVTHPPHSLISTLMIWYRNFTYTIEHCYSEISSSDTLAIASATLWYQLISLKACVLCLAYNIIHPPIWHFYSSVPIYGFQETGHFESPTRNTSPRNLEQMLCPFRYAKVTPSFPLQDTDNLYSTFSLWCNTLTTPFPTLAGNDWENIINSISKKQRDNIATVTNERFYVQMDKRNRKWEKESWRVSGIRSG